MNRRNVYFTRPPTRTNTIALRTFQSRVAMNAPTNGTTGATRFNRMIRSSFRRRNCVQRRIARSSGFGIRVPWMRRGRAAGEAGGTERMREADPSLGERFPALAVFLQKQEQDNAPPGRFPRGEEALEEF